MTPTPTVQEPTKRPARDPRLRRHSSATVALARRMYADGDGWTPTEIVRYLTERGTPVALSTVRTWVVPGMAEVQRAANMASYRRRRKTQPPDVEGSATPILDRMQELHAVGVSYSGIARVVGLDHGVPLTPDLVRYYMRMGREPVQPKRRAGIAA